MSIRAKLGFTSNVIRDLEPDSVESIAEWYDVSKKSPMMLDLGLFDELASYLVDSEGPDFSRQFREIRSALLSSGYVYKTTKGKDVFLPTEPAEGAICKRLDQLYQEDTDELRAMGGVFSSALAAVREDGHIAGVAAQALSAWSKAVDAIESFFAKPRLARRIDLEDMLMGVDRMYTLIDALELYRRLLLAAGVVYNELADATLGHLDFSGMEEAVCVWKVSEGKAARRLGAVLAGLADRTPELTLNLGLPEEVETGDTSWIADYSRLGQAVMGWVLARDTVIQNFAAVGPLWPGPAVYGGDDEEADARAACELCSFLSPGTHFIGPLLSGTEEVVVGDDLSIQFPLKYSDEGRRVYLSVASDECGTYLVGRSEERHFAELAKSIRSEVRLDSFAWSEYIDGGEDDPDDIFTFEGDFSLHAYYERAVDILDDCRISLSNLSLDELRPGANLFVLGNADHFEIMGQEQRNKRFEGLPDIDELLKMTGCDFDHSED